MLVEDLLVEVERRGVALWPNAAGDGLRFGPAAALTPELVEEIKEHKAEILARLCDLSVDPSVHFRRKPVDPADGSVTRGEAQDWADYDRLVLATMARIGASLER